MITISNDSGAGHTTQVIAEDGTDLTALLRIRSISIELDEAVKATAELVVPRLNVKAQLHATHNGVAVKSITLTDGMTLKFPL